MKILKGLLLSLLSLLLFLSLTVFGIAFMLHNTLLKPDFVVGEIEKLDISLLTGELLAEQLSGLVPAELGLPEEAVKEAVYDVISAQEPWLKEQAGAVIYAGYDYLLGESDQLVLSISIEPLKQNLRDSVYQVLQRSLPPELALLPPAQLESFFDNYWQQFADNIPDSFEIDESLLPPEVMEVLVQARQYISYFQSGYYLLIGLMALLVLLIALIHLNVRGAARSLGITFVGYGAVEFAGVYLARNFMPSLSYLPPGVPPSVQTWLLGLSADLLAPLQTFSLVVLAAGVVLLIVSFVYPRRAMVE